MVLIYSFHFVIKIFLYFLMVEIKDDTKEFITLTYPILPNELHPFSKLFQYI